MATGKKTGGRQAGTPNRATASLKALAQQYSTEAIAVLVDVMKDAKAPHAARVSAADKLLDRGYGRPPQALTDGDGKPLLPTIVTHRLE